MPAALSGAMASLIRHTGRFRGKWRLVQLWSRLEQGQPPRHRVLPGGGVVLCDLGVPYEAMAWLGQEEQRELEVASRLLAPGDLFVDCGANIGLWTIVAAVRVGPPGRVWAFEPNPATFYKLGRNVALNNLTQVQLHCAAVGAEAGTARLVCATEHNVSRLDGSEGGVEVPVVTLDAALGNQPVAGCKIDVEGSELAVLEGAIRLLRRARPWICVECNPRYLPGGLAEWPVHQLLRREGYLARRFEQALAPGDRGVLAERWRPSRCCNLQYLPAERAI